MARLDSMLKCLLIAVSISCLAHCATTKQPVIERENAAYLSKQYADFRSRQISDVRYHYAIDITSRNEFSGYTDIRFILADKNFSPVTIDFEQGEVGKIKINGKEHKIAYDKWFINIPPDLLAAGSNQIEIEFRRPYSNDGQGLHQYQDAESKRYYLYTQFEPYAGNRFAPMFDQPDIKATFSMDVLAPRDWQVITATREARKTLANDHANQWRFPASKLIPSYIFSLHAGPYKVWEEQHKLIPLRLFVRQEMAEFVDLDEWWGTTKASFDFLQDYFEFPYPFEKYDQIIVPDFNFGAMENLAAVTFAERYLSRGKRTEQERYRLANTIAHEMVHMWFGNIVTMRWWDDLWLNESFATHLAYTTIAHIRGFENVWTSFAGLKGWAYYEDQLVTTHPIHVPVQSTDDVFNLFDGISYAKGASVLKQLSHFVGEPTYQKSIASYIRKHQYQNTQLKDFSDAIAETSKTNMDAWGEEWLLTPGVNTIKTEFHCETGRLKSVTLSQTAPLDYPTLRSQKVQLGIYQHKTDLQLIGSIPVTYSGTQTTINLTDSALACPDFIYPNQDDWGYLKIRLNNKDIELLSSSIRLFKDETLRLALWQALWALVHDAEAPLTDYVAILDKNIVGEQDTAIVNHLLQHAEIAFNLVESMGLEEASESTQKNIERIMWRELEASEPGSSRQKRFLDTAIEVSLSDDKLAQLVRYLKGSNKLQGLPLDPDSRWGMIIQLSRYGHPEAQTLAKAELKNDASERAQSSNLAATVIQANEDIKEQWLKKVVSVDSTMKLTDIRTVSRHLYPGKQQTYRWQNADLILASIAPLTEIRDGMYWGAFGEFLPPAMCTQASVDLLQSALTNSDQYHPTLVTKLKIAHQNDQRCIQQKKLMEKSQH